MAAPSDFWLCIGAAVWTIIQTIIHAYWIIYGRKLIFCPNNPNEVTRPTLNLYFTQIQTYSCNNTVENDHLQKVNSYVKGIFQEKNESELLFSISYNYKFEMTDTLMNIYIVHDALWIIASVSLFVGTVLRIKETAAIIFFAPWITLNLIGITFDVFSAVYYCLQIPHSQSKDSFYTPSKPDNGNIFGLILPRPIIMALVSGRFGLFWLLNFFLLVLVTKGTIKAYRAHYQDEARHRSKEGLNNSAQVRIKNWQQFYGVIEESSKNDLSYTNTFKDFESNNKELRFNELEGTRTASPFCSTMLMDGSNMESRNIVSFGPTIPMNVLGNQLPWTYTPANNIIKNNQLPNIKPKPKRVMRIYSTAKIDNWDSSIEQVSKL